MNRDDTTITDVIMNCGEKSRWAYGCKWPCVYDWCCPYSYRILTGTDPYQTKNREGKEVVTCNKSSEVTE